MKKLFSTIALLTLSIFLVACDKNIEVSSLVVASEDVYLNPNKEFKIDIKVIPTDASNKKLSFVIDKPLVATVDENGVLKGISLGNATLTVSSVSTPSVILIIKVHVVLNDWPNAMIKAFAGFELPPFLNFTAVEVIKTEDILTLNVNGITGNINDALLAYGDLLVSLGWEKVFYDNHSGQLTHTNYDYIIEIHNEFIHQGNLVEVKIIKVTEVNDYKDYDDLKDELLTNYQLALPDFLI